MKQRIEDSFDAGEKKSDDELLVELQKLIFRYDISILKKADRLALALDELAGIKEKSEAFKAPHVHSFVRARETQCMIDACELIFRASAERRETRLSHFREDYPERDDANWLKWFLAEERNGKPHLWTEPIPTPLVSPEVGAK